MGEGLSEEQQQRRRRAVADLMPTTPFLSGLGIVIERYEPDEATVRLPFREDLTNDGTYYHGGVVASAIDTKPRACSVLRTSVAAATLLEPDACFPGDLAPALELGAVQWCNPLHSFSE